jgi:hypothetical protein
MRAAARTIRVQIVRQIVRQDRAQEPRPTGFRRLTAAVPPTTQNDRRSVYVGSTYRCDALTS